MKIVELRAENLRRIRAVCIRPAGDVVPVTGANEQGKTSVLDAIWIALRGKVVAGPEPIRIGCERATIRLDLGDMVVVREFKRRDDGDLTTSLKITLADGSEVKRSPQATLDALVGDLSFDPLEFARADPRRQLDMMRSFVPGFDFDGYLDQRQRIHDARTVVSRRARDARAAAAAVKLPPGPRPKRVDVSAVVDALGAAGKHNADIQVRVARRQAAAVEIVSLNSEVAGLKTQAEEAARAFKVRIDATEAKAAALQKQLDDAPPLPDLVDVDAFRAKVAAAEAANASLRLHDQRDAHEADAKRLESEVDDLTKSMSVMDESKRLAIEGAALPVVGMKLGDGEVLLNDIPLSQASHAEKLRVSLAVAMAANPKLRVIRSYDGSLLDRRSMQIVADMARDGDYQVWIERVDETGEVGFYMEDGGVAAAYGERVGVDDEAASPGIGQ